MQDDGGADRDDGSSDAREEKCAQVSESFHCTSRRVWAAKFLPTNFQTASARSSGKSLIGIVRFDHISLLRARNKPLRAPGADTIASIEPGFPVLECAPPRPLVAAATRDAQ
jgi:hypothetical protein